MRYRSTPVGLGRRLLAVTVAAFATAGVVGPAMPAPVAAVGEVFTLTPGTIDFGSHALGTTSSAIVTLTNGDQDLSIGAFTIGWAVVDSPNPFSVRPNLGCTALTTLPALGTCDVTIDFVPLEAGSWYAPLQSYLGGQQPPDVSLYGTGTPSSNVAWTAPHAVRGGAWTTGTALARTTHGTAAYLHALYESDLIGSRWATDTGPRVGVYYRRSTNGGTSFAAPVRINPSTTHAARGAIAAYGSHVYAVYVTQTKWIRYSKTAPRVLYIRTNTKYGVGAWGTTRRLTALAGRVDYPVIAAAGNNVYVAYTDAVTGRVKVATSRNGGSTFATTTLGSTTNAFSDGKAGVPSVAAYGSLVIVAWTADTHGKVVTRVSRDAGRTWTGATLATTTKGYVTTGAASGRLSVAWPTVDGLIIRTWRVAGWGPAVPIAPPVITGSYAWFDTPAIALQGSAQVGAAWSACRADCSGASPKVDLVWSGSSDGGATFDHAQVLAVGAAQGASYPANLFPSIVWGSATARYVMDTGEWIGEGTYTVQIRTGTGAP
jgi:hypothetical protein